MEFGLVVLLLVMLISGMFDFGLLLNVRLSASSMSRELARSASLGVPRSELVTEANRSHLLGVTTATFAGYCCDPGDAVVVTLSYYDQACAANCPPKAFTAARPGDRVEVVVTAMGAEVLTPLVRPAFGCTDGSAPHCFQPISAQTTMRFEGP